MTTFLQLALLLSIILLSAKLSGYLSVRVGQPSVLGELLVGILLSPSVIDLLHLPFIDPALAHTIVELGELALLIWIYLT
jgi:Na+:H+ antiporter